MATDLNQPAIVDLYRRLGCRVRLTSQPRKAKYLSSGIPDLVVWHIGKGAFWFHEVKSGKGAPSDGQVEFKEDCEACGVVCLVGGEEVARDYLREIGVLI